jgi:iron complex outermembrane receptor protein
MPHSLLLGAVVSIVITTSLAHASNVKIAGVPDLKDLAELSVEQLSRITVTSVARRAQPLATAPSAVYVITNDAIRRSGATTLPEALRLAPNLQVARADVNQYAISARGFNNVLANKLLVMIDGRTVYSPLFSGVFWEAQHVMLEDVERIEVISGPGSTLWGANAVNGVINVITRRAADTQGALVSAGIGNREASTALRWGGKLGDRGHYRVYGTIGERDSGKLSNGMPLADGAETGQAGFRTDWRTGDQSFMVSGDAYRRDIEQSFGGSRDLAGAHLLMRWQKREADDVTWRIQAYYDRVERDQPGSIKERLDTWDMEAMFGFRALERHRVLVGAGYRFMSDDLENLGPSLAFIPPSTNLHRAHVFVQDDIGLTQNVDLTLGLKLEHNTYSHLETLPNARLSWRLDERQLLWTALSRAIRAPSRIDRELYSPALPPYALAGGRDFRSEVARVFEIGYRAQPIPALSYSISVFRHEFDRLRTIDPAPSGAVVGNGMRGSLNGIEAWGSYRVGPRWRLTGGLTRHWQKLSLLPGNASLGGTAAAGNDPTYTWQLGSAFDLSPAHELDVRIRRVGELPIGPVPAYTAVDVNFGWHVTRSFSVSLTVQNLLDPTHAEWGNTLLRAESQRAAFLKLRWQL